MRDLETSKCILYPVEEGHSGLEIPAGMFYIRLRENTRDFKIVKCFLYPAMGGYEWLGNQ